MGLLNVCIPYESDSTAHARMHWTSDREFQHIERRDTHFFAESQNGRAFDRNQLEYRRLELRSVRAQGRLV